MTYPHENMPLADLVAHLRRAGAVWFNNRDLLLLEELIRRAGANTGDDNGQRESVRNADVRGIPDSERSGAGCTCRSAEEIAEVETLGAGWHDASSNRKT